MLLTKNKIMIIDFKKEIWLPYRLEIWSDEDEYLISNYGRVKRKKIYEQDWKLSKSALVSGYVSFWIKKKEKKRTSSSYAHRAVAFLFVKKREDQKFVIHLDFDKTNNVATNLKWVNRAELNEHNKKNPVHKKRLGKRTYSKLTEGRVRLIKRKINGLQHKKQ